MEIIDVIINKQAIKLRDRYLVSDTVNSYKCKFSFDSAWESLGKTAVFTNTKVTKEVIIDTNGECVVPWEVLADEGTLAIGVYGSTSTSRYPTVWSSPLVIKLGCQDGDSPTPPTPSEYQQMIALYNQAITKVEEAKTVANQAKTESSAAKTESAQAVSIANTAKSTADTAKSTADNAKSTADSVNAKAESALTKSNKALNDLTSEITRAKARENEIEAKIPSHDNFATKTELQAEETRAKAKETELDNSKVNKVDGKELSSNDYTDAEKTKLAGVEDGANKYVLPSDVPHDSSYVHTDNNYTTTEKNKLASLENYDDTTLKGRVETVENKIPTQASSTNQLADKEFVNSSIATETANFKGTFDTLEELQAVENPTNNDYGFVKVVDSTTQLVKQYDRYKYVASTSSWTFEYTLNNSSFTASQWNAINSGATQEKISSIANKVDKEDGKGLFSGSYNDLTNKPTIPEAQIQADWNQTDSTAKDYIKNKPQDLGKVDDVKVNGSSVVTNKIANIDISGKVDKVDGKGLSTNDYTDAEKLNTLHYEGGTDPDEDEVYTTSEIDSKINVINSSLANKADKSYEAKVNQLENDIAKKQDKLTAGEGIKIENNVISYSNDMIYGVSRQLTSSSSAWSRTDASIGKVANATKDGALVQNDFDVIYPWSDIKTCNMNADGSISAWYGDVNFKFDGTNGDVMTYVPPFYYRRWQDGTNEHIQVSKFSFDGALLSEGFYIGRYNTDNDYKSRSNKLARVNTNIATFRNNSRAKGSKWQQLDWHYFLLEILYLVEYADYNSQTKLGRGYVDCSVNWSSPGDTITEVVADNQFVCSSTRYKVGQYITIGTSYCGMQISDGVKITAKSGSTYTIENSYTLSVGNNINSSRVMNGQCDGLGMRSGCYRTDGIGSVIYRGIENIFGNVYQFVDGINIQNYVAYINYNPSTYESNVYTGDYAQVGYTNANSSNTYAKKVGFDSNHPMVALCTEVGGSESTYLCDYYYQNSGNRIALVGGNFDFGGAGGLFFWLLSFDSGYSSWFYGGRLLRTI